ncbi:MAG: WYL domain-containing protein [Rhodospirillaceae bacterium]
MARNIQLARLLKMIGDLSTAKCGILVQDMAEKHGVTRRTLERDIEALIDVGFNVETLNDDVPGRVRKRIGSGAVAAGFLSPNPKGLKFDPAEIAAARAAALALEREAPQSTAATFRILVDRIEQIQATSTRNDGDFLSSAQEMVGRPGHRSRIDAHVLKNLQEAIKLPRRVIITYRRGGGAEKRQYPAEPYGILLGGKGYLVWRGCADLKYRKFALPYIEDVEITDETFALDEEFSLKDYAGQSVGVMADEVMDVELRIASEGLSRLNTFEFHPSQNIVIEPDGSATVRFQASGRTELCWELFKWGRLVSIEKPEGLREAYAYLLNEAVAALHLSEGFQ